MDRRRVAIDLGSFDDADGDGLPDLNPLFHPVFVDKYGQRIAWATQPQDARGGRLHVRGQGVRLGRSVHAVPPADIDHAALLHHRAVRDSLRPASRTIRPRYTSPHRDALALVSNAGAQQFISAAGKDRGGVRAPTKTGLPGISLDDPDRDGYCEEISEGDLDVAEWYLLNHPAPRAASARPRSRPARSYSTRSAARIAMCPIGICCRTTPMPRTTPQRFDGDRRFFDLQVAWNDRTDRLEGKVALLADRVKDAKGERWLPRRGAYTIRGIYSDFKFHDVGEDFYQMQFDGSIVKKWKTTPLWGVGTTAPYGHDGASLDLDSVIRRHGGEALAARTAYTRLTDAERMQVICFLQSLVLYQTDQLPCDVNGDGKIDGHFMVQGVDTGLEKFNPEWLFRIPVKIEGPIRNIQGGTIMSCQPVNLRHAYGLDLQFLRDTDGDGFPDVIDPEPHIRGYRDGVK